MISNTPWNRSRKAKAQLYEDYPEDLRPVAVARRSPRTSARSIEFTLPILLLVTQRRH